MTEILKKFSSIPIDAKNEKIKVAHNVKEALIESNFTISEEDINRPWGGFIRLDNQDGDSFVDNFFEGLDPKDARLGNPNAELSPKILIVAPAQRLSWQYHDRRAERWMFINDGGYHKSVTDDQGDEVFAHSGDVVQFEKGERHRLVGAIGRYTLVAEIWQHTNPDQLSDEDDIVRLQDDYKR